MGEGEGEERERGWCEDTGETGQNMYTYVGGPVDSTYEGKG